MGWDSYYTNDTTKQVVLNECKGYGEVMAISCHGRENHVAIKIRDISEATDTCIKAYTVLVDRKGGQVSVKIMSEDVEPFYYKASKKVLDALTEAESQSARDWREKCRSLKKQEKEVFSSNQFFDLRSSWNCNGISYKRIQLLYSYKSSWIAVGVDTNDNPITAKIKVSKTWIVRHRELNIHA